MQQSANQAHLCTKRESCAGVKGNQFNLLDSVLAAEPIKDLPEQTGHACVKSATLFASSLTCPQCCWYVIAPQRQPALNNTCGQCAQVAELAECTIHVETV